MPFYSLHRTNARRRLAAFNMKKRYIAISYRAKPASLPKGSLKPREVSVLQKTKVLSSSTISRNLNLHKLSGQEMALCDVEKFGREIVHLGRQFARTRRQMVV